jgi:hypothetical protein
MNKTARRALQVSAAFTGLATAVGLTGGTALAVGQPTAMPSHSAPSDAGASLNAPTARPSDDLHSFSMPTMKTDRSDNDDDVPTPERATRSKHYTEGESDHYRGYKPQYDRESDKALRHSNSNGEYGYAKCKSEAEIVSPGYNGDNKANGKQDADDYDNDCVGYHAPRGANQYDNANYYGYSQTRGQGESGKLFGDGLF